MPHPLYTPEIREMLDADDGVGLAALCEELHPATVAQAIDEFDTEPTWKLLSGTPVRTQAAIFEYLPGTVQVKLLDNPSRPQVVKLIEKMSHDDRVDLLKKLPTRVYESLLRLVDDADRRDMKALFEYGEGTVGAIMTTDYAWLPPTLTAAEAVDQLRAQAPDKETIYYIYVLGEPRKRPDGGPAPRPLQGIISLRDLIPEFGGSNRGYPVESGKWGYSAGPDHTSALRTLRYARLSVAGPGTRSSMNILRERVALSSSLTWPEGVGSWLDIYDDEFEEWPEDEDVSVDARRRRPDRNVRSAPVRAKLRCIDKLAENPRHATALLRPRYAECEAAATIGRDWADTYLPLLEGCHEDVEIN